MRTLFHPAALHPLTGDPGLWVDLPDEGRAVLLDLPSLTHVPPRKLLRVAHAVVTHTHMDHFVGFDHLLRIALRREDPLAITGPAGFLESVRGRIAAYTWNLIASYPVRLRVQEVDGGILRSEEYSGTSRMRPVPAGEAAFEGTVHAERGFRVEVATLDHGVPVLGVVLREVEHLAVNRDRLERLGFVAGDWLSRLKDALRRNAAGETPFEVPVTSGTTTLRRLDELAAELIVRGRGQVVAYLTDLAGTDPNLERAAALARDADLLVCEAAFLHEDAGLASERNHLTARQAGELARRAGARRLAIVHASPRYEGREDELYREAGDSFGEPVIRLAATIPA